MFLHHIFFLSREGLFSLFWLGIIAGQFSGTFVTEDNLKMKNRKRLQILLSGQVQGVGCRPYIYQLASLRALTGFVCNDKQGVTIEAQGEAAVLDCFIEDLRTGSHKPPMLKIDNVLSRQIPLVENETQFHIQTSRRDGSLISRVCPDIATCANCLAEMNAPSDLRYRYPFINCTQCGPRYSIVKTIPYDRPNTTMAEFAMCPRCREQYETVADRRFHAQPLACPACGPKIALLNNQGDAIETDSDKVISQMANLLRQGKILAIKGIGGFHLAVDAKNDDAVRQLRKRKRREAKPFAMMAANIETIKQFTCVDSTAEELLTDPAAPIVLLTKKIPNAVAPSVAEGTDCFGVMLPYAPLHHLLFAEEGIEVLVMTSANLSDEPLICDNQIALTQLKTVADFFVVHDRPIYRQVDDSVIHFIDNKPAFLRRSRGYVPQPIPRAELVKSEIFAAGADLKNTFCFAKDNQYILSEYIGDLEKPTVYQHYIRSIDHLAGLFEAQPRFVVHDLHPGYFSTQYAKEYARRIGAENIFAVQHHWAHAAAVMAEHNLTGPVIGLIADGTGYGTDGAIWGCECLICSFTEFQRAGHLEYYPLSGGDMASIEPIRPLLGLCRTAGIEISDEILARIEPDSQKIHLLRQQIEKQFLTASTSSLGRLFDVAAALAGLGNRNHFEAQLPMALESIANPNENGEYPVEIHENAKETFIWSIRTILEGLLKDVQAQVGADIIAARFHNTICRALLEFAVLARQKSGLSDVVLGGGVFCNRYLTNRLIERLRQKNFRVFWNQLTPAGDGCIALGQAAIQSEMIKNKG
jgi:hydrogenase maturation protein HypF